MNNPDLDLLGQRIEDLIREHIAACRGVARSAIERALAGEARRPKAAPSAKAGQPPSGRRTRAETEAVAERLYEAVVAEPGATMMRLAPKLKLSSAALQRPMELLRKGGRVRTIGARIHMQYYPIVDAAGEAA
jgi:hypothetical protein